MVGKLTAVVSALALMGIGANADCIVQENVDMFGSDLDGGTFGGTDIQQCIDGCLLHPECTHLTFAYGNCYLKHSGDGQYFNEACASATCSKDESAVTAEEEGLNSGCTFEESVDYFGFDIAGQQFQAASKEDCVQPCLDHPDCNVFTYIWNNCYLKKSGIGKQFNLKGVSGNCLQDETVESVLQGSCTMQAGIDFEGNDIAYNLPSGDAAGCGRLCLNAATCTAYTFVWNLCYLKTSSAGATPSSAGAVSGECSTAAAPVVGDEDVTEAAEVVTEAPEEVELDTDAPVTTDGHDITDPPAVSTPATTSPATSEVPPVIIFETVFEKYDGCCRTKSGSSGTYSDKYKATDTMCSAACAAAQECLAYELHKGSCELHTEPIVQTAAVASCKCNIKGLVPVTTAPKTEPEQDQVPVPTEVEAPSSTANCVRLPNTDLVGGDVAYYPQSNVATIEDCERLCIATLDCTHLSFIYQGCYLKNSNVIVEQTPVGDSSACPRNDDMSNPVDETVIDVTEAPPADTAEPDASAGACFRKQGIDLGGNDLPGGQHKDITNIQDCEAKCLLTDACTHLTLIWNVCYLKTSDAGAMLQPKGISADCTGKPSTVDEEFTTTAPTDLGGTDPVIKLPETGCTRMAGTDFAGQDLPGGHQLGVGDIEQCEALCLAHEECTHLTVIYGSCFLKSSGVGAKATVDGTSSQCNGEVQLPDIFVPPPPPPPGTGYVNAAGIKLAIQNGGNSHANLPKGVLESQGAAVCGSLYVFGGFVGGYKKMQKKTYKFTPKINKWEIKMDLPGDYAGITHTGNAWDEGTCRIWIVGGLALKPGKSWPGAYAVNDAFEYDAKADTWKILPGMPAARGGGASVYHNGLLYHFNGASFQNGFIKDYGSMWSIDTNRPNKGWQSLATNPHGRNHLGGVVFDGIIYAIGGQYLEEEGCTNQNHVQKYSIAENKWSDVADMPQKTGHISPSTIVGKYGIIVVGGATNKGGCSPPGKHTSIVQYYNPTDDKWFSYNIGFSGGSMITGLIGDTVYSQHDQQLKSFTIDWEGARRLRGRSL
jgi:hypothetical protein